MRRRYGTRVGQRGLSDPGWQVRSPGATCERDGSPGGTGGRGRGAGRAGEEGEVRVAANRAGPEAQGDLPSELPVG